MNTKIESSTAPHPLSYMDGKLCFDHIPIESIAADHPTPFYLYSLKNIKETYQRFHDAALENNITDPMICFALKSNNNNHVLGQLQKLGAGADIVSGGELKRSLLCGITPDKIVFSGVGKNEQEINLALRSGNHGIYSFNVESPEELELINRCAETINIKARISFRLNPKVNAKTHKNISTGHKSHKFGMIDQDIFNTIKNKKLWNNCQLVGLSMHIGSQLTELSATKKAIIELSNTALAILPNQLEFIDVGGGLGIPYEKHQEDKIATIEDYMKVVSSTLEEYLFSKLPSNYPKPKVVFEPGRIIVGRAGVFVTKVLRTKQSEDCHFTIVDGGMNDFARPALYNAHHQILSCNLDKSAKIIKTDIVGPVCETTDCFATSCELPALHAGDLIVIADAGAYGHTMASNYNMREHPFEVVIPKPF